jgi:hypothetical protein
MHGTLGMRVVRGDYVPRPERFFRGTCILLLTSLATNRNSAIDVCRLAALQIATTAVKGARTDFAAFYQKSFG